MQRDEAKAILELCRPGSTDDQQDPLIAEALGMLESDAELKAWFDEQQALDSRIAETLNKVEPPAELKASILAGMRAHALRSEGDDESEKAAIVADSKPFNRPDRAWWRNPWIGIAAVFAVLLAITTLPQQRSTQNAQTDTATLNAGVPDMIQFLAREINDLGSRGGFEKASNQPEVLQAYLASAGAPSPSKLPHELDSKPTLGCFTFDYNGVSMGMICFQDEQVVHLITVRKSDCPRSFQPEKPTVYQVDKQAFKAWTDGEHVYILSTQGSKEKLPEMI